MNEEEVHIDEMNQLVKFVFSDNRHNNRMVIESSDFKNTRDLFFLYRTHNEGHVFFIW